MRKQAGDTIIEVIISGAILALVLSVAFMTANRSLRVGTDAANRNQAVQYASQQVELLRESIDKGVINASNNPSTAFCIDTQTRSINYTVDSNGLCHLPSLDQFGVGIKFQNQTYVVTTAWPSSLTSGDNQVVIYYQEPL